MNKRRIYEIIDIGRKEDMVSIAFDYVLTVVILLNVAVMFLMTFDQLKPWWQIMKTIEVITMWFFVVEYILRIWTADVQFPGAGEVKSRWMFISSLEGIIDLLTILPFFFLSGMAAFRILRVIRIFHLFRINAKVDSLVIITTVLKDKKNQILSSVMIILIMMMASSICMYSLEHQAQPQAFANAFSGMWWSVSAMLTVGYGDIYPITVMGKILAIIIAFLGVGLVAIPTGIISAGFVEQYARAKNSMTIPADSDLQFVSVEITEDHKWRDLPAEDCMKVEGMSLVMLIRDGRKQVPKGEERLRQGDYLVFSLSGYGIRAVAGSMEGLDISEDL